MICLNTSMKIPKLKYYSVALNAEEYRLFESSRELRVWPTTVIDTDTGQIYGRTQLLLSASAAEADTQFRITNQYRGSVYVLRIPRECVDRSLLKPAGSNCWYYGRTIRVEHCGVDRFDLDTDTQ